MTKGSCVVMLTTDGAFYRQWVFANGWAESAGLGTTFVIGRMAAPFLERATGVAIILGGALVAVLLGALLEGVLVGAAQESVLRQRLIAMRPWTWINATAVGAGLAWLIGMVPSTIVALTSSSSSGPDPREPSAIVQYTLAMALGFVTGPILGFAQWTVLRGLVDRPGRWLWANALAWAIGMPVIFAGMDRVPWTAHTAVVILAIYAVCGVAGLVVGGVHGRVLLQLLQSPAHATLP